MDTPPAGVVSIGRVTFTFDAAGFIYRDGYADRLDCLWSSISRVGFTSSAEHPELALYVWGMPSDDLEKLWSQRVGAHLLVYADHAEREQWDELAEAMATYSAGRTVIDMSPLPARKTFWQRFREWMST